MFSLDVLFLPGAFLGETVKWKSISGTSEATVPPRRLRPPDPFGPAPHPTAIGNAGAFIGDQEVLGPPRTRSALLK